MRKLSDNTVIKPGSTIPSGTTVYAQVSVKNDASSTRTVQARVIIDRNKWSGYDYDKTSSGFSVSGNGGTRTITLPAFTPSTTSTYTWGFAVLTYVKSKYVETDSWPWQ